jgi:ribonuclease HI
MRPVGRGAVGSSMAEPPPGLQDAELPPGTTIWPGAAVVHFDGAFQAIRGHRYAAYGFTVDGAFEYEECGLAVPPDSDRATNNVAEYAGAIAALEWLRRQKFEGVVVLHGDSQLVVRQMEGEYEVRSDRLRPYHEHLQALRPIFSETRFVWIPREENTRADELSKLGIDRAVEGTPRRT